MADATLLRTPLHGEHLALSAKMVPFAGYEMPVQYPTGITAEHHAVRSGAGLFDVSHMGEFEVRGERALEFVQHVSTNDASKLEVGQAQYSTLLNEAVNQVSSILAGDFSRRGLDPEMAPLYAQALVGSVSMAAQWWLDVREPKKEVVAAHLVNLCWNGLMHLEDDPQLLDE